jgi:hypothetical protein
MIDSFTDKQKEECAEFAKHDVGFPVFPSSSVTYCYHFSADKGERDNNTE